MKYIFLLLCYFAALSAARAQEAPRGAGAVVMHSSDSARVVYARAVRALVAAGYGVVTNDATALFARTPPKPLDGAVTLTLSAAAVPAPGGGSDLTLTGVFTWFSAISIMAQAQAQPMPVRATGGPATPVRRSWNELVRVAGLLAPGAPLVFH